ncbi:MAG: sirohydrochlorin chelatase [Propionibacteriaceae bacterium]
MTPPLVLLAHGSRHREVTASIAALAAATADCTGVGEVLGAFLDLTVPDLTTVVAQLSAAGHQQAVVVPLLFTPAFHARVDTPAAVAAAADTTGVDLVTADVLGTGDDLLAVLDDVTADHAVAADQPLLLHAVGSSRPEANAGVADLADRWQHRRGGPVTASFATADPRTAELLPAAIPGTVVVPLFVSPGLLLDRIGAAAAARGTRVLPPLGTRLAPVVAERFRAALVGR